MKIIVNQVVVPIEIREEEAAAIALARLGISSGAANAAVCRRSIDARRGRIQRVYSVLIESERFDDLVLNAPNVTKVTETKRPQPNPMKRETPPVVVGFGPCGMFAALAFAKAGLNPMVIERGSEVDARAQKVEAFWKTGKLDEDSNVQFGEGGAGTFSDGKLVTRTNDSYNREILEAFVEFGADKAILIDAKPHIGTDKLRGIIKNIRAEIIRLGGTIHFDTRLSELVIVQGKLEKIKTNRGEFAAKELVLATGHSSRDIFTLCKEQQIAMEKKPFSVGMRIEHTQAFVNQALYGAFAVNEFLPQGEYQLAHRVGERGCYTFCMCPGGTVVAAASEIGGVVTNGMSESGRDGKMANSAIVASVLPSDLDGDILSGMNFAREIEQKAFALGGGNYVAPAESALAYLTGSSRSAYKTATYTRGIVREKLEGLFPKFVNDMLKTGLYEFDKKHKGFAGDTAILTGAETRTSSPIRILRNEAYASSIEGIFPAGEGAGYAGGIMSAAADGIRVSEKIMDR